MRPQQARVHEGLFLFRFFFRCSVGSAYDLLFRHIFSLVTLILIILLKPPTPPFSYMCSGQRDGIGSDSLQIGTENKKLAIFIPRQSKNEETPKSPQQFRCMYTVGIVPPPPKKKNSFLPLSNIPSLILPPLLPPPRRISPLPQHLLQPSSLPACTR